MRRCAAVAVRDPFDVARTWTERLAAARRATHAFFRESHRVPDGMACIFLTKNPCPASALPCSGSRSSNEANYCRALPEPRETPRRPAGCHAPAARRLPQTLRRARDANAKSSLSSNSLTACSHRERTGAATISVRPNSARRRGVVSRGPVRTRAIAFPSSSAHPQMAPRARLPPEAPVGHPPSSAPITMRGGGGPPRPSFVPRQVFLPTRYAARGSPGCLGAHFPWSPTLYRSEPSGHRAPGSPMSRIDYRAPRRRLTRAHRLNLAVRAASSSSDPSAAIVLLTSRPPDVPSFVSRRPPSLHARGRRHVRGAMLVGPYAGSFSTTPMVLLTVTALDPRAGRKSACQSCGSGSALSYEPSRRAERCSARQIFPPSRFNRVDDLRHLRWCQNARPSRTWPRI